MQDSKITVFLADDNLIVREGVRALLSLEPDIDIVGVAGDYDGLVSGAEETNPQVVITDIRMPPNFQREGIDAAKEVRKRHPGTAIIILSQYDDPEYVTSLLKEEDASGFGYLLKDRIAEENQLAQAVREVAAGGSKLDPKIVSALVNPVSSDGGLTKAEEDLLNLIAEGRPIKGIAAAQRSTPARCRRRSRTCSSRSPRRPARAPAGPYAGCGCCTRPSSNGRSRARA
ncbi:MAG TPA: response regulator transcription factor [Acidimicrobiales bacterium]|nr:response regulator transcription factor [Acidimicrobiales bacterium]